MLRLIPLCRSLNRGPAVGWTEHAWGTEASVNSIPPQFTTVYLPLDDV